MFAALAILFRRKVQPDPDHLRRVFLAAMAATGSDTNARNSEVFDSEDMGFHFVVGGPDALDCHVYFVPVLTSTWLFPGTIPGLPRGGLSDPPLTTFIIESSPLAFPATPETTRRIALATADLLDTSAVALIDMDRGLLVAVSPTTAQALRSTDPESAFASGMILSRAEEQEGK